MEMMRIELMTVRMQSGRATNCATFPLVLWGCERRGGCWGSWFKRVSIVRSYTSHVQSDGVEGGYRGCGCGIERSS